MSDRPWLEGTEPALRAERALLKRLNAQQPPPGSVEQGWAALSGEIAALKALDPAAVGQVGPTHALAHGAGASGGLAVAAKLAAGVALAGGALWAGSELLAPASTGSPSAPREQPVVPTPAPVERRAQVPEPVTTPQPAPAKTQRPASTARPATATTLAEEGRLLARAHELVQAGQGKQALEVLRASESRYPRSVLFQEREVLTIEALGVTGSTQAARSRAERFLQRYPKSPHAGRLQRFVE